jgi:hypothetical protein
LLTLETGDVSEIKMKVCAQENILTQNGLCQVPLLFCFIYRDAIIDLAINLFSNEFIFMPQYQYSSMKRLLRTATNVKVNSQNNLIGLF